jgi:hypothetical protein
MEPITDADKDAIDEMLSPRRAGFLKAVAEALSSLPKAFRWREQDDNDRR